MSWRRFNVLKDALLYHKDSGLFAVLAPLVLPQISSETTSPRAPLPESTPGLIKRGEARVALMNMLHLPMPDPN
jgi:hypothetical protein